MRNVKNRIFFVCGIAFRKKLFCTVFFPKSLGKYFFSGNFGVNVKEYGTDPGEFWM